MRVEVAGERLVQRFADSLREGIVRRGGLRERSSAAPRLPVAAGAAAGAGAVASAASAGLRGSFAPEQASAAPASSRANATRVFSNIERPSSSAKQRRPERQEAHNGNQRGQDAGDRRAPRTGLQSEPTGRSAGARWC